MTELLTTVMNQASAAVIGEALAEEGYTTGTWENQFVSQLAKDVMTLQKETKTVEARVEALEKFTKRVKNYFERRGINSDGDLRLLEAARELLKQKGS